MEWEKEELSRIRDYVGADRFDNGKFDQAKELFNELVFWDSFEEFLTLKAYPFI